MMNFLDFERYVQDDSAAGKRHWEGKGGWRMGGRGKEMSGKEE